MKISEIRKRLRRFKALKSKKGMVVSYVPFVYGHELKNAPVYHRPDSRFCQVRVDLDDFVFSRSVHIDDIKKTTKRISRLSDEIERMAEKHLQEKHTRY